ncbi:hypothetical protein GQ44DRAFT_681440 [Phaeosphaeriaceae sp. PMI808]|nr:hypothetical protein GQ44DRAFT_681440 [Phaeosphaeriaceae sp. PMI808]
MGLIHLLTRQQNGDRKFDPAFLAETRVPQMLIGNITVQTVGCLIFFLRIYSRVVLTKQFRREDYLLVGAWLSATAFSICQYGQINHGAGRHAAAVFRNNPNDPHESQKYAYAAQIAIFPALAMPKLSICASYLRIFYTDILGRRMILVLIVILNFVIIPMDFLVIFQCKPIHVYWSELRPKTKCPNQVPSLYVTGAVNVIADIALMAIVLPRVLELKLHRRQRWALVSVVLLGSLAVVAGIVRMVRVGSLLGKPGFDPSWHAYDISIWTNTEIYVSLICASAPGMKPVIVQILPKLLGSTILSRSRTRQTGNGTGKSIELGLRLNSSTNNSKLQGQTSQTALATADGPYTECGRGMDADSFGGRMSRRGSEEEGIIFKTSEITVQVARL